MGETEKRELVSRLTVLLLHLLDGAIGVPSRQVVAAVDRQCSR